MNVNAEEREALEQLVLPDEHDVLDGAVLSALSERGLATFSSDGWEATRLGRLVVEGAGDA